MVEEIPLRTPLDGENLVLKGGGPLRRWRGRHGGVIRGETWLVFQGDFNLECVKIIIKFKQRCWSSKDIDYARKIWCSISWFRACSCSKLMINVSMYLKSTGRRGIGHENDNKGGVLWSVKKVDGAQHVLTFNEKFVNVSTMKPLIFLMIMTHLKNPLCWFEEDEWCINVKEVT